MSLCFIKVDLLLDAGLSMILYELYMFDGSPIVRTKRKGAISLPHTKMSFLKPIKFNAGNAVSIRHPLFPLS